MFVLRLDLTSAAYQVIASLSSAISRLEGTLSDAQAHIDADTAELSTVTAEIVAEFDAFKRANPTVDTSALDAKLAALKAVADAHVPAAAGSAASNPTNPTPPPSANPGGPAPVQTVPSAPPVAEVSPSSIPPAQNTPPAQATQLPPGAGTPGTPPPSAPTAA